MTENDRSDKSTDEMLEDRENFGPVAFGHQMVIEQADVVPIGALEDLVAQWRERTYATHSETGGRYPASSAFDNSANELQETIDDYRSEQ